jgi:hypothetical protein
MSDRALHIVIALSIAATVLALISLWSIAAH